MVQYVLNDRMNERLIDSNESVFVYAPLASVLSLTVQKGFPLNSPIASTLPLPRYRVVGRERQRERTRRIQSKLQYCTCIATGSTAENCISLVRIYDLPNGSQLIDGRLDRDNAYGCCLFDVTRRDGHGGLRMCLCLRS